MLSISPGLGEMLVKTTGVPDLDTALQKVFTEYIELEIINIIEIHCCPIGYDSPNFIFI
jgi:hypothetical protein